MDTIWSPGKAAATKNSLGRAKSSCHNCAESLAVRYSIKGKVDRVRVPRHSNIHSRSLPPKFAGGTDREREESIQDRRSSIQVHELEDQ